MSDPTDNVHELRPGVRSDPFDGAKEYAPTALTLWGYYMDAFKAFCAAAAWASEPYSKADARSLAKHHHRLGELLERLADADEGDDTPPGDDTPKAAA